MPDEHEHESDRDRDRTRDDAQRVADAIDEIGVDRLSELIVDAWERHPDLPGVTDEADEDLDETDDPH